MSKDHHSGCSDHLVAQALRKHESELHQLLASWLADHPKSGDPVAFIELEGKNPGLSQKIRTRNDALATMRGERFNSDLIHKLAHSTPVPVGSVDLIVCTPDWLALERVTPRAKGSA